MEVNKTIISHIESDASMLDEIIDKVVSDATGALESYVESIKQFLENGVEDVSLDDLNSMSLRVASYLFFLSSHVEKVGLRSSIASIVRDEKYSELKAHPENAYGNYSEIEVIKNKATNPNRKLSKFAITYDKGLDGYIDTINMAITYGVIEQAGAWFSFFEQDGSIVNSESDELCKCQGKSSLVDYLRRNKDVYERIQLKLNEEITKED